MVNMVRLATGRHAWFTWCAVERLGPHPAPYTLHSTTNTLHPTHTLLPTTYTFLLPILYSLFPTPYSSCGVFPVILSR